MAKKSQKRSKQNKAKKVGDLPVGPKATNVKGGGSGGGGMGTGKVAIQDLNFTH